MSPAEMAYLIYGDFRTGMLSTLIINLAVKKYIKIRKSKVNITYQLEVLKEPDNNLSLDEAQLVRNLFAQDSKIIINGDKMKTSIRLVIICQILYEINIERPFEEVFVDDYF